MPDASLAVTAEGEVDSAALPLESRIDRVAAAVFAALILAVAAWYLVLTRHLIVAFEDFRLIDRGLTPGGFLEPYNGHLSIVPLAIYQLLARVAGTSGTFAYRLVSIGSLLAIPVAIFCVARRRVGTLPAVVAGSALLFYPGTDLTVAAFNHYLAFLGIVACAWLLAERPDRSHLWCAAALTFALASSGVSVAGAAGCVAFVALTRPPWRRWVAIGGPIVGWIMWRQLSPSPEAVKFNAPDVLSQTWHGLWSSFNGLAFDNRVLGAMLAAVFLGNLAWQLRKGPRHAAHQLAWTFAAVAWWAGLAMSRGWWPGQQETFRYDFIGSGFLILAFLPTRPHRFTLSFPRATVTGVGVTIGCVVALALANIGSTRQEVQPLEAINSTMERLVVYVELGPEWLPDRAVTAIPFAEVDPGTFRMLFGRFGVPHSGRPADPDKWLLDRGDVKVAPSEPHPEPLCLAQPAVRELTVATPLFVAAGEEPVTIQARLTGSKWHVVGHVPAHQVTTVSTRWSLIETPWKIRAVGACATP